MLKYDKVIIGILLGCVFPLFFFLASFSIWFYFDRNENYVLAYVITGLILGFTTDLLFLKTLITRRFELPIWLIAGIYLIYNIWMYGIFMGFPVFNLLWGCVAGYYFGRKINFSKIPPPEQSKLIKRVSIFTSFIMTLICFFSGWIALAGTGVGKDLQMMFNLHFEITKLMILATALIGGAMLIYSEYKLTKVTMLRIIKTAI